MVRHKTVPTTWNSAGPTYDGLRNYVLAGNGLGSGSNPEKWLDKVPMSRRFAPRV